MSFWKLQPVLKLTNKTYALSQVYQWILKNTLLSKETRMKKLKVLQIPFTLLIIYTRQKVTFSPLWAHSRSRMACLVLIQTNYIDQLVISDILVKSRKQTVIVSEMSDTKISMLNQVLTYKNTIFCCTMAFIRRLKTEKWFSMTLEKSKIKKSKLISTFIRDQQ